MIGNEIDLIVNQSRKALSYKSTSVMVYDILFSNFIYIRLYGTLYLNLCADGTYSKYSLMTSKKEMMLDFRILNT